VRYRGGMVGQDHYSPSQAARILGLTDRHVRHMLDGGELAGEKSETGRWRIEQSEVHRMLEERRRQTPAGMAWYGSVEAPGGRQEAAELRVRVEDLQRTLGRLEGRLELTEMAESTMQAERARLIEDLERERERSERLERELEDARRPWWRRMFGSADTGA
jgi:excisionase family DNA binding protein